VWSTKRRVWREEKVWERLGGFFCFVCRVHEITLGKDVTEIFFLKTSPSVTTRHSAKGQHRHPAVPHRPRAVHPLFVRRVSACNTRRRDLLRRVSDGYTRRRATPVNTPVRDALCRAPQTDTRRRACSPSVVLLTLGKGLVRRVSALCRASEAGHSAKGLFAECPQFDTRRRFNTRRLLGFP